jgi:ubiquinol-cytochrome c reductase subunit 7
MQFFRRSGWKVLERSLGDWYRDACGHRKLGLRYEDLLEDFQPDVKEAIRRLPAEARQARYVRQKVSTDTAMKMTILPKEQWVRPEEDLPYLRRSLREIRAENADRRAWRS